MSAIRTALVDATGVVVDVIITDPTESWEPPEGHTPYQLDDESVVGRGWTCAGGVFTAPAETPAAVELPTVIGLDAKSKDQQAQIDALTDYILSL